MLASMASCACMHATHSRLHVRSSGSRLNFPTAPLARNTCPPSFPSPPPSPPSRPPTGLVFTPLSQPYLQEWGSEDEGQGDWQSKCPQALYHLAMHAEAREPGEQVVVLSQVLQLGGLG